MTPSSSHPLSSRQQRLWVLEELGAPPGFARIAALATTPTRIDGAEAARLVDKAIDNHPVLGARFDEANMHIGASPPRVEVIESKDPIAAAREFLHARPAQMKKGGLTVGAVIQGPTSTVLLVASHRAIADVRSLETLLAQVCGTLDGAAVPSMRHDGGIATEPKIVDAAVHAARQAMAEIDEPAELTGDRQRQQVQDLKARGRTFPVSEETRRSVTAFAQRAGVSEEAVWLAAFAVVFGRYTRKRELVFGRRFSRRRALGLAESAIGALDNDAVFRASLLPNLSCLDLTRQVAQALEGSKATAGAAFEDVVGGLAPPRDLSRAPLFQVLFGYRDRPDVPHGFRLVDVEPSGTSMDMEVHVTRSDETTHVTAIFAEAMFTDAARAERLVGHIETIVAGFVAKPDAPHHSLPVVTEAERRFLASTEVAKDPLSPDTLAMRIARMAKKFPDRYAVSCGDARLTYAELETRATRIARKLRDLGVQPNDRIAICMDRTERLIVALYGILKAGGAYVPVEPTLPKDRLAFVLTDAEPKMVLVESDILGDSIRGQLPTNLTILRLDQMADELAALSADPLPDVGGPDSLAYIIYTSGSTGLPKGCLLDNGHVIRLFDATAHWFGFDERDVWTMFHSVAFDFSVWEIWGALTYGGRVAVVPYLVARSPDEFRKLCATEGVTVLNQTPSAFRQFIAADARVPQKDLALRTVVFGGEALELESLRPWFARWGDQTPRLINMYGITETTVHVTYRPIALPDLEAGYASVIGIPIPDLRCYVVDDHLELVPVGVPGEMLVAGRGVARGYWKRPELTAERFQGDKFSGAAGERIYRSGDLVKVLPNGEIDYLGRIDMQVKIRGFRIETGDVEAALRKSGLVTDVAVLAAKKTTGAGTETVLVAWVVTDKPTGDLRTAARAALPEYMVPSVFTKVASIPMTGNGKVDRKALPDPWAAAPEHESESAAHVPPRGRYEELVAKAFAEVLRRTKVSATAHFFHEGGSSLDAVTVSGKIGAALGVTLPVVKLFEHTTVEALARYLENSAGNGALKAKTEASAKDTGRSLREPVAIIGVSCRVPGAPDPQTLWKNLLEGKETITWFDDLDPSIDPKVIGQPTYVKARGVLPIDPGLFDAGFFSMSPREAEITDPQHRLALELAWEALEYGGYDPARYPGAIGVYAGEYNVSYYAENLLKRPDILDAVGGLAYVVGNEKDFIATRIAHKFDLRGPALSLHTACSTSLVAVANAVWALRTGQCDMALAGACAITCPPKSGYLYQEGGMLSPDGHTRPFDAKAGGTVFSDGGGFVLLKRLSDAERDGDDILAVIHGVATNNDGASKASFTAPSATGQAEVVARALADGGIKPDSIGYVEAHGTATPLGDPIELDGLRTVFDGGSRKVPCGLGSIKSNFGHLVAASGVLGLTKAAFAVKHNVIPPTLHFTAPNPKLGLEGSPFAVVDQTQPFSDSLEKRRAGVSSFGVGGTNAHVVIEEAPVRTSIGRASRRSSQLLVLSARSETALTAAAQKLAAAIADADPVALADASFTLGLGRHGFAHRRFVVASSGAEAAKLLTVAAPSIQARTRPRVAFAFPGQGAQYVAMGRALAKEEPVFKEALERCVTILNSGDDGPGGKLDCDLRIVLDPQTDAEAAEAEERMIQTAYTQPAIFAIEYALAELWQSWGVRPEVLIGHSVGEFVAATLAGVLSLEDALRLVLFRGRMMQAAPRGVMLSVRAPADAIAGDLGPDLVVCVINSPKLSVVGGPAEAIDGFVKKLEAKNIASSRLRTSHAFHSPMMDSATAPFLALTKQISFSPPSLPIVSTVTGEPMTDAQATDPAYWARQLREPVRFADALARLWKDDPDRIVLEVGPRATLATLAKQIAQDPNRNVSIASIDIGNAANAAENEPAALLRAAGALFARGVPIDFEAYFDGETRRRRSLPTYPFERKRYWLDPPKLASTQPAPSVQPSFPPPIPVTAATTEAAFYPVAPVAPPPVAAATPSPSTKAEPVADRTSNLLDVVRNVFEEASGVDLASADPTTTFMELGLDSLSLTQCAQLLTKRIGGEVTFRQLMEDLFSLDALVKHLDATLPPDQFQPAAAAPPPAAAPEAAMPAMMPQMQMPQMQMPQMQMMAPMAMMPVGAGPQGLVAQQLNLITQQVELLKATMAMGGMGMAMPAMPQMAMPAMPMPAAPVAPPATAAAPSAAAAPPPAASKANGNGAAKVAPPAAAGDEPPPKKPFGPGARIEKTGTALPPEQEAALKKFIDAYVARTPKSKAFTAENRPMLADPRVVTGFKPMWKEIVYPLVVGKSEGSKIWDIDGNEFVDLTCGFGANFLGHRPPYVVKACHEQLDAGFEIGPQHPLVADCAKLVRELTGAERVIFCTTGSEAVLGATRLARTVTGRSMIVSFTGDYHGILDEVILRGTKTLRSIPGAPGILPSAVQNNLVLDYGEDSALKIIEERAGDIAAVLVEPVQSRRPDLQPTEFLKKLRALCTEKGIALIFDEIITGFRLGPGGAQEYYGVKADLATYGKILGGGIPIGAIAGIPKFMDALDGGKWSYGDASVPEVGVTYFAGTFVRHPVALAACKASLTYIKEQGPDLQKRINEKNKTLVTEINAFMKRMEAPFELTSCSSWFKLAYPDDLAFGGLIFFWLRHKGIHIWDGRVAFLTVAHTDEDIAKIKEAFFSSIREMQAAGFLPKPARVDPFATPPIAGARLGKNRDGSPAWFVPDAARPGKFLLYSTPTTGESSP